MKFLDNLKKEFSAEKNIKTLKTKNYSYNFDMRIFQSIILFLVVFMTIIFIQNDFNVAKDFYVKCETETYSECENPLYLNDLCFSKLGTTHYLCNTERLPDGYIYGQPPNPIINYFIIIAFVLFFGAFILNHYLNNKTSDLINIITENLDESDKDNKPK